MSSRYRHYSTVMAVFAVLLVLSNTTATKLVQLGPFVWSSAIVLFPLVYILGDVITEVYGYAGAKKIFWVGLLCNILMSLTYLITGLLPALDPEFGVMYSTVLNQVPRIVIASMLGLWVGQFSNAYIMSKMRVASEGRNLWQRMMASTLVGEALDTVVFCVVGFYGVVPVAVLWQMIYSATLFKAAYEAVISPVTYVVIHWFKRQEGYGDDYSAPVNYNPFGS